MKLQIFQRLSKLLSKSSDVHKQVSKSVISIGVCEKQGKNAFVQK